MIEEVSLASCIIPYNLEDDRRGFFGKLYIIPYNLEDDRRGFFGKLYYPL
jgi:hypothetical protein